MRKRKERWQILFDKLDREGVLDELKKIREEYKRKLNEEQLKHIKSLK